MRDATCLDVQYVLDNCAKRHRDELKVFGANPEDLARWLPGTRRTIAFGPVFRPHALLVLLKGHDRTRTTFVATKAFYHSASSLAELKRFVDMLFAGSPGTTFEARSAEIHPGTRRWFEWLGLKRTCSLNGVAVYVREC